MKRNVLGVLTVALVAALGLAMAVGPATKGSRPAGGTDFSPRLAALAQVLGKDEAQLRAQLRRGGLRALVEESGLDPLELQRKLLEVQLAQLDAAYREGRLSQLRYESLKARLQARKLALAGPSLAELVARSGGDVEILKAQLRALEEARIGQLLELGVISEQQAELMKANLDTRVERMLTRPAGLQAAGPRVRPQTLRKGAARPDAARHRPTRPLRPGR